MYKKKYYKYKNKYMDLVKEKGFEDPDKIDAYNSPDLKEIEADEVVYDVATQDEEEVIERLEDLMLKKEDFQGFSTKGVDFATEDLQQVIIDVGQLGEVRGKVYEMEEFDPDVFTNVKRANKNKIVNLVKPADFDTFTSKYGKMKNKKLFINWPHVAKDYRGIHINSSVLGGRGDQIPFQDRTTTDNWVNYDYNRLDEVIIFQKPRNMIQFKEISKPFRAKVVDEYAINADEDFAKISDPITYNKILLVDDVKSFDKFTNKYGILIKGGKVKIDWEKVNHDYDGFYLDKDADFKARSKNIFYKNNEYPSWLSNIHKGVVYIFD